MPERIRLSRRAVLSAGALGAAVLAGCTAVEDDAESSEEPTFGYGGVPVETDASAGGDDSSAGDESDAGGDSGTTGGSPVGDGPSGPIGGDSFGGLFGGLGGASAEYGYQGYGAGGYGE